MSDKFPLNWAFTAVTARKFFSRFILISMLTVGMQVLCLETLRSQEKASNKYYLGPGDALNIRVYDLRKTTGEAYPWAALNGEFSVGSEGYISMPILGEIKASGKTSADVASDISVKLRDKADLADIPASSVEVSTYRNYYIIGEVQQPGKYEFQPNLTVLQAVSTAQGFQRSPDYINLQRQLVMSQGDVRALNAEHITLEAKSARLFAEINNIDVLTYPPKWVSSDDPRIIKAIKEELLLFNAHKNSLKAQITAIDQSKLLIKQELASLELKSKTLDRQIDISQRELGQINDLVARGLAITPRKLAAEQTQASYESSKLDVQLSSSRAQQALSRSDRDIIELQARARKDALDESADIRAKLDQSNEKLSTAVKMIDETKRNLFSPSSGEGKLDVVYTLTRVTENLPKTYGVEETDFVQPGDVIRVAIRYSATRDHQ